MTIAKRKIDLERSMEVEILMIHIDECLYENSKCEGSCYNSLEVEYFVNCIKGCVVLDDTTIKSVGCIVHKYTLYNYYPRLRTPRRLS